MAASIIFKMVLNFWCMSDTSVSRNFFPSASEFLVLKELKTCSSYKAISEPCLVLPLEIYFLRRCKRYWFIHFSFTIFIVFIDRNRHQNQTPCWFIQFSFTIFIVFLFSIDRNRHLNQTQPSPCIGKQTLLVVVINAEKTVQMLPSYLHLSFCVLFVPPQVLHHCIHFKILFSHVDVNHIIERSDGTQVVFLNSHFFCGRRDSTFDFVCLHREQYKV
mmetsp:Transcript_35643/g.54819  ORF Transcript_35643/g.54819 Transcript_35643/m.54819 type:complete len:217 (+) Transcript_35643:177-827(+)